MYFRIKNTLKNNRNYTPKQAKSKVTNELEPNKRSHYQSFFGI